MQLLSFSSRFDDFIRTPDKKIVLLGLENRVLPFTNEMVITGVAVGSGVTIISGTIIKLIEPKEELKKNCPSVVVEILVSKSSENIKSQNISVFFSISSFGGIQNILVDAPFEIFKKAFSKNS
jgi:hypothetical protein